MLEEYLDKFIIVYLNNIIIYSNSKKEYKKHIKQVLSRPYKENMPIAVPPLGNTDKYTSCIPFYYLNI